MSTTTTTTERLPHRQVIDNVRKLAPSWGGSLSVREEDGVANFRHYADLNSHCDGDIRPAAWLDRLVDFDPATGSQAGEPLDFVEIQGLEGSAYLDLADLPRLLNALGELAAAASSIADQEQAGRVEVPLSPSQPFGSSERLSHYSVQSGRHVHQGHRTHRRSECCSDEARPCPGGSRWATCQPGRARDGARPRHRDGVGAVRGGVSSLGVASSQFEVEPATADGTVRRIG